MKNELRIDFPDYPAKEQERDAMRSCFKQIYLMRIDGKWAHYGIIDRQEDLGTHDGDLTETYFELKNKFPQHRMRVIQNKGLEDYLRDMLSKQRKKRDDSKQLNIWEIKKTSARKELRRRRNL